MRSANPEGFGPRCTRLEVNRERCLALYDEEQLDSGMVLVDEVIVVIVIVIDDIEIVAVNPHDRPRLRICEPVATILEPISVMAPVGVKMMIAPKMGIISRVGDHASAMARMNVARTIGFTRRLPVAVVSGSLLAGVLLALLLSRVVLLWLLPHSGLLLGLLLLLLGLPLLFPLGRSLLALLLFRPRPLLLL